MKALSIVAWVLVVVLLIGAGALGFLFMQQSGKASGLSAALVQAGTAAGVEGLAPESLKDAAALPDVLQKVEAAIQTAKTELSSAKDALSAAQTEASGAKAEVATLSQTVKDQSARVETLTKDMEAKDAALAEAKALAEQAALETKDAQAQAEKKKAELEGTVEGLKAKLAEETARLQAELDAARQQIPEPEAAPADASQNPGGEMTGETPVAEKAAELAPEPEADEVGGRIAGQSQMFSLIRYSEDRTLHFRLLDGQTLTYQDVSQDAVDHLFGAGDNLDVSYRFKIQGVFKSLPPDSVVIRKFWKWQRRHPAKSDVRVIEPEAPPAAEPAPAEASEEPAASAEEPAASVEAPAAPAAEAVPAPAAEPAPAAK